MFTKAGLLIAILLVFVGYRWGKRKAQAAMQPPPQQQPQAPTAAPRQPSWLSVRVLLIIAIVLLIIAIFTSLQRW